MALTERISDGLSRVPDGIVNWYLVEEEGEVALLDPGWPRSWPRVTAALREVGHEPSALRQIVLTHAHPDHLGAAEEARRATGATVHVHEPELGRAFGHTKGSNPFTLVPGLLPTLWRPSATAFVIEAALRGFMFPTWLADASPFDADAILDVPGRPRAVPTPGHTEGHVALIFEDQGVAMVGDALTTMNVLTRERGPRLMPDELNADPGQTRWSLQALEGLPADTLLPGHGDPYRGEPARAVEMARERYSWTCALHGRLPKGDQPDG